MGYGTDDFYAIANANNTLIPVRLAPALKAEFEQTCRDYGISVSEAGRRMAKAYWRDPYHMEKPKGKRKGETKQIRVGLPPHLQRDLEGWQIGIMIKKWTVAERKRREVYKATQFHPPELKHFTIKEEE
jgi:hypothetical protein